MHGGYWYIILLWLTLVDQSEPPVAELYLVTVEGADGGEEAECVLHRAVLRRLQRASEEPGDEGSTGRPYSFLIIPFLVAPCVCVEKKPLTLKK